MSTDPTASAAEASTPIIDIAGSIATIRLNRPAAHNRLEPQDVIAIRDAIEQINASTRVQVLVITGTGRSFSSGFDLRALSSTGERAARVDFEALTDEIEQARPVTIARLNGPVYGGSTDLALACDFRIGIDTMRMFVPAAKIGLQYYGHGLRRWVSRVGLGAAKRVFLTGQTIEADEMKRIGYLDECVPAGSLDATVATLVNALLANAPRAVEGMKRVLNDAALQQYDDELALNLQSANRESRDLQEGFRAMAEKRPPRFTGD